MKFKLQVEHQGKSCYVVRLIERPNKMWLWHKYKDNVYGLTEDIQEATAFDDETEITVAMRKVFKRSKALIPVMEE